MVRNKGLRPEIYNAINQVYLIPYVDLWKVSCQFPKINVFLLGIADKYKNRKKIVKDLNTWKFRIQKQYQVHVFYHLCFYDKLPIDLAKRIIRRLPHPENALYIHVPHPITNKDPRETVSIDTIHLEYKNLNVLKQDQKKVTKLIKYLDKVVLKIKDQSTTKYIPISNIMKKNK